VLKKRNKNIGSQKFFKKILTHPVVLRHPDLGRVVGPHDLHDDEDEVDVRDEEHVDQKPVRFKILLQISTKNDTTLFRMPRDHFNIYKKSF
jgi:hypothetical protein